MLKLLRKMRMRRIPASLLSGGLIIAYSIMTGFGSSAVRALMMFSLKLLAECIGRTYDTLSALALAGITILIEHPLYLYQAGFQLSFGAIMGIALVYPIFADVKKRIGNAYFSHHLLKYLSGTLDAVLIGFSIQITTLPIILWNYYAIPVYGIFLNLLIVPFMVFLFGFGICGGLVGIWFPGLAKWLLYPCKWILDFYSLVSSGSLSLPGSQWIIGKPQYWQLVMYYILLTVVISLFYLFKRKHKYIQSEKKERKLFFVLLLSYLVIFLILIARNEAEFNMSMLSVGQGECVVVWGRQIPTIMIDGGSTDTKKVWKYRIAPFLKANAISQIDYVMVSHCDLDHISGIMEAMEELTSGLCEIKIQNLLIPYNGHNMIKSDENANRLYESTKKTDVIVCGFTRGDDLTFPMQKSHQLQIKCLHPPIDVGEKEDRNFQSMVLSMKYKDLQVLFTGDINQEIERVIADGMQEKESGTTREVSSLQILKIAHHGSKNSTSEVLLNVLKPDFAMISCGEGNRYGHPADEVLYRLDEHHIHYEITKEKGAITVRSCREGYLTDTFLK